VVSRYHLYSDLGHVLSLAFVVDTFRRRVDGLSVADNQRPNSSLMCSLATAPGRRDPSLGSKLPVQLSLFRNGLPACWREAFRPDGAETASAQHVGKLFLLLECELLGDDRSRAQAEGRVASSSSSWSGRIRIVVTPVQAISPVLRLESSSGNPKG